MPQRVVHAILGFSQFFFLLGAIAPILDRVLVWAGFHLKDREPIWSAVLCAVLLPVSIWMEKEWFNRPEDGTK